MCSITLGTQEVTPLEMADAFATLASRGIHHDPTSIAHVKSAEGKSLFDAQIQGERVLRQNDADLVTLRTFAGQAAIAVENVRVHEEAQRLSHTDALTSLYNYRTLKDSLRREVERASRFGHRLCVLALDLDRFKQVNDSYGHAAGDVVLVEFARRVRSVIREVDLAFRRGGEEFVVLLPETDAPGGIVVAERLAAAIRSVSIAVPATTQPEAPFEASTTWRHMSMKHRRTPAAVVARHAR